MVKEGLPFIAGGFVVGAVAFVLRLFLRSGVLRLLSVLGFLVGAFCMYFFRDPDRTIPQADGAVVSAGDGKVVEIVAEDDPFAGKNAQRVSVFLSIFDVHVNRVPIGGTVIGMVYRPGTYLAAFNNKASEDNEQTHIGIQSERGTVAFKQIAGLIARRIVCTLRPGDTVRTGERCGLIRFGSRVDVILPASAAIRVRRGQRVKGGETIIGMLP